MLLKGSEAFGHLRSNGSAFRIRNIAIIRFCRKGRASVSMVGCNQMENELSLRMRVNCLIVPRLNERAKFVPVSGVTRVVEVRLPAFRQWFGVGIPNRGLPP